MHRLIRARPCLGVAAALCAIVLAGCRPEPPPTEQPPEPQAHTELRDAIQAPQHKAAAVEDALQQGAASQRAQIDAAEGG
ncbi:hypothetical protein B1992_03880 [Pseudoxanthomonas broegbernensis]|uniref:Lipoprotein n=1 Tax=Pseudoxanthomonas broegbernensis TaxID=83619 RepID=A0A7V8GNN3_9GAMM|nr:hypothetical protein [Pseudoxanthomonas broegbernensis]KAF1687139.1 hypothetical protein B1992_03880 [Pseudoxanthomonas broegbernensis]MBB6065885.1 hypothetical protein [Pseudoxanthomonas broegbernensis]